MSPRRRRQLIGFAAAVLGTSLAVPLAGAAVMLAMAARTGPTPGLLVFGVLATAVAASAAGILFGLPLTWVLAVNRLESGWVYPLSGFAAGAGAALVAGLVLLTPREVIDAVPGIAAAGAAGALYGALWWHFGRRHLQGGE